MNPNPIGNKLSILFNPTETFAFLIQMFNAAKLNPNESEPNWEKAFNAAKFNPTESEPDWKRLSILLNRTEIFAPLIQIFNAAKFNPNESETDRKQTFNSFKSD